MKKLILAVSVFAVCFTSCKNETKEPMETDNTITIDTTAIATDSIEMTEEPVDSVAMQKAWEAYMTPGEPHQMLADEVGTWTNDMTFWMEPNGEPSKATSNADIKMILGGRYQETTYTGDMMGMRFEGRATVAYDNAADEFISTWIDNMGTGMMIMRGKYDEGSKSMTMTGSIVDPMTGKEKQMREVYTIVDENTRKMEFFDQAPGGGEYKSMEFVMKRKM